MFFELCVQVESGELCCLMTALAWGRGERAKLKLLGGGGGGGGLGLPIPTAVLYLAHRQDWIWCHNTGRCFHRNCTCN